MKLALIVATICSLFLGSCSKGPEVVVYTALDLAFSEPILKRFERETGISVRILSDTEATKTTGLVNKIIAMKDRQEADVFWNNEVVRTILLKRKGLLEKYLPEAAKDIPANYKDPEGYWTGFAARARVILINTDMVKEGSEPASIEDLAKPEWKGKVALANPLFGTTSTHAAALFATLGAERAKRLFLSLKENDVRIVAGNAMARNMVMNGEIAICLTDTDDANGAYLKQKPVRMIYPDQGNEQRGMLVIPNAVALIKGAPNPENGKRLIEFILSAQVEQELAKSPSAQLPVRKGIAPYSEIFSLDKIKVMAADYEKTADALDESTRFVQETFLR